MSRRFKWMNLLLISILLVGVLGACSSESSSTSNAEGKKTLRLLTPIFEGSDGKDILEGEIIPKFNEEYPDVNVEVEYTTYAKLNEKLTTGMVGGTMPDVLMMGVGWIEGFAKENQLKSLSEFDTDVDSLSATYNEKVLQAGVYKDELYAIPIMLDARLGVYSKKMFEEAGLDPKHPPENWDELREYAKKLTKRDSNGNLEVAGVDLLSYDHRQIWLPFLWQNGGKLFDEEGNAAFNSTEGVEALTFYTNLVNKDKVTDVGFETGTDASLIGSGMAAMAMAHNNIWTNIEQQNPEALEDIEFFVMEEEQKAMFYGGTLATISESTEYPEEAFALLTHLTGEEASLLANEQRGNVPARMDLLDSEYVQNNKGVKFAMENLEYAYPEGGVPEWLEIRSKFTEEIEQALYKEKTPKEALSDLEGYAEQAKGR